MEFKVIDFSRPAEYKKATQGGDIMLLRLEPLPEYTKNLNKISTIPIDATDSGMKSLTQAVEDLRKELKTERDKRSSSPHGGGMKLNALFQTTGFNYQAASPSVPTGPQSTIGIDKETKEGIANTGLKVTDDVKSLQEAKNKSEEIQKVDGRRGHVNLNLYAAGFGGLEFKGAPSAILQRAQFKVAKDERCKEAGLMEEGIKPESIVCAIAADFRSNTCQGDSGGPTYTDDGTKQTLLGLMSYGKSCSVEEQKGNVKLGIPGIRTRIFFYREWIASTIEKWRRG